MRISSISIAILSLAACAAGKPASPAQSAAPAAAQAADGGAKDPNQIICFAERTTGSNLPERVCKPRWKIEYERQHPEDQ